MANIKPRFEVHKLPGTTSRPRCKFNKENGGFIFTDEEVDAGFMVYLPSGASVHCWDENHLKSLGFEDEANLVDMETGEEMGRVHPGVLKSRSNQLSSRGRRSKPGLEEKGANS